MYEVPKSDEGLVSPTYREAYPALKLVGVRNRYEEGYRYCFWADRFHNLVDKAEILECTPTDLTWLHPPIPGNWRQRQFHVDMRVEPTRTGLFRPYAICPGCLQRVPELYFVSMEWKCSRCHSLVSFHTLLKPGHKMLMRARRLNAEVGGGNPAGIFDAKYVQKTTELQVLRSRLTFIEYTELPPELRPRVAIDWADDDDDIQQKVVPLPYSPPGSKAVGRLIGPVAPPRSERWW